MSGNSQWRAIVIPSDDSVRCGIGSSPCSAEFQSLLSVSQQPGHPHVNGFHGLIRILVLFSFLPGTRILGTSDLLAQSPSPFTLRSPSDVFYARNVQPEKEFSNSTADFLLKTSQDAHTDSIASRLIDSDWDWKFLPKGFLYHTYWASVAEPRLSTQTVHDFGGHHSLDSHIGGRLGIVRFGEPDAEEGFQLDLMAGVNLRQNTDTSDWDMTGTDYRYDIPLTYRRGRHAWKFGFYHVSSHMGDEFLAHNPTVARIDYYRDSLYFGYSYYVTPEFRIYGEIDYAFSRDFAKPWHLQFGFDWGPAQPTGIQGAPFFAINGHLREELNFSGNISLQAGWAWREEGAGAGTLRTGLFFYNGGSPQYSFYRQSEQQLGWGLWYDF